MKPNGVWFFIYFSPHWTVSRMYCMFSPLASMTHSPLLLLFFCLFLPATVFIKTLYNEGATPTHIPRQVLSFVPSSVYVSHNGNICKRLFNATIWTCESLLLFPLLLPGIVFTLLWGFLGFFLYETQVMSIGAIRYFWYSVWVRDPSRYRGAASVTVDTDLYNRTLFGSFIFETIPFLAVQIVNNELVNDGWTHFQILCAFVSGVMVANGLWQFVYLHFCKGKDWVEIPLSFFSENWPIYQWTHIPAAKWSLSSSSDHVESNCNTGLVNSATVEATGNLTLQKFSCDGELSTLLLPKAEVPKPANIEAGRQSQELKARLSCLENDNTVDNTISSTCDSVEEKPPPV